MVETREFRQAHVELDRTCAAVREAARRLPSLAVHERAVERDGVLDLLAGLEGHMALDERVLFPEVAERLGDPLATASMSYDHLAIRQWIADLEEADPADPDRLQELLYGLDALMRVHIWKENVLYLPVIESSNWPSES
jgi:iron-sulfur cluster repair protein YtfE (RIC family)